MLRGQRPVLPVEPVSGLRSVGDRVVNVQLRVTVPGRELGERGDGQPIRVPVRPTRGSVRPGPHILPALNKSDHRVVAGLDRLHNHIGLGAQRRRPLQVPRVPGGLRVRQRRHPLHRHRFRHREGAVVVGDRVRHLLQLRIPDHLLLLLGQRRIRGDPLLGPLERLLPGLGEVRPGPAQLGAVRRLLPDKHPVEDIGLHLAGQAEPRRRLADPPPRRLPLPGRRRVIPGRGPRLAGLPGDGLPPRLPAGLTLPGSFLPGDLLLQVLGVEALRDTHRQRRSPPAHPQRSLLSRPRDQANACVYEL